MIKIENTEIYGWETAIRGMRNPMNSWDKSDSFMCDIEHCNETCKNFELRQCEYTDGIKIGKNDLALMKKLINAGSDHRKFLRMIVVTCDITAPLYWWKEFDTYKVGTVRNSCSTMHKITEKRFNIDDFSHEHLINGYDSRLAWGDVVPEMTLETIINALNFYRQKYLEDKNKDYWWQIIQLLPSSYNQKATVQLNYEVLLNIYQGRKNHKLDEWQDFCKWVQTVPYGDLITSI